MSAKVTAENLCDAIDATVRWCYDRNLSPARIMPMQGLGALNLTDEDIDDVTRVLANSLKEAYHRGEEIRNPLAHERHCWELARYFDGENIAWDENGTIRSPFAAPPDLSEVRLDRVEDKRLQSLLVQVFENLSDPSKFADGGC